MREKILALCLAAALVPPFAPRAQAAVGPDGWTDLLAFLVRSDGTRSLGTTTWHVFNSTRDKGSKIVYFNNASGDNAAGQVYWWDGSRIIDSAGNAANPAGQAYGTDPLRPNEAAIKPFRTALRSGGGEWGDLPLRSHFNLEFGTVAGGYPDWFLFRRGQTHTEFGGPLDGGRSEAEPMVIAAYGPPAEGRAVMDPVGNPAPGSSNPFGDAADPTVWLHEVMWGLEFRDLTFSHVGSQNSDSPGGGPVTLLIEDCKFTKTPMAYLPQKTTFRRGVSAFNWDADAHNQGYFTHGWKAQGTFEDAIFYKNGFKDDPRTNPDPRRTIYDRNVYQGGGAQMGHTYRNIVSADGGSGSPQMRLGGLIENSLIIEGYWFSGTYSIDPVNNWMTANGQAGRSAVVRDNVQLVLQFPSPGDPDSGGGSDARAQFGGGYELTGASFGALVENNIISHAMLADELGLADAASRGHGFKLRPDRAVYEDGNTYTHQRNLFRGNIAWRTNAALQIESDWTGSAGSVLEGNVFVSRIAATNSSSNIAGTGQLEARNNRFYTAALPTGPWVGAGNTLAPSANAAAAEGWPDPNRTLKRYVTEVLGLSLLDWSDDPWVTGGSGAYDPMGLKTFMAVAINMRKGGANPAPSGGKPSWTGDYAWDHRYTGEAVVNWIRAGFGLPPAGSGGGTPSDNMPPARPRGLRMP
jgi:hypothetical protein